MTPDDEIELFSPLDQPIVFDSDQITQEVDGIIQKAIVEGDPEIAIAAGRTLITSIRLAGLGMIRLLWGLKKRWGEFELDGVDFDDYNFSDTLGLSKTTITRYVRIGAMLESEDVPNDVRGTLLTRQVKDLSAIATSWDSGFPINDEQWTRLAEATDNTEILETLREVKNTEPRHNSIRLVLEDDGSIRAWHDNQGYFVGYLDRNSDNPIIVKAINRISNLTGMRVK